MAAPLMWGSYTYMYIIVSSKESVYTIIGRSDDAVLDEPSCQAYNGGPTCQMVNNHSLYVTSRTAQVTAVANVLGKW